MPFGSIALERPSRVLIRCVVLSALLLVAVTLPAVFLESGTRNRWLTVASFGFYWFLFNLAVGIALCWKQRWREIVLTFTVIALALAAAELLIRIALPHRAIPLFEHLQSSRYHHVLPAGRRMYQAEYDGRQVFITTNADGLRTTYSRETFLSYRARIAVLGDSFAFGFGVRQAKATPKAMESRLRRELNTEDLAVLNAGTASYSPLLEERLFKGVIQLYQPQLVVLLLDATDIGDDYRYSLQLAEANRSDHSFDVPNERPKPYLGAIWNLMGPYQRLLAAPFEFQRKIFSASGVPDSTDRGYYEFSLNIGGKTETNRYFIYRHPLEKTRPFFDQTAEFIDRIAERANRNGAKFMLVVLPRYHHWNPKECPADWQRPWYAVDEPYQLEYFRYFEQRSDESSYRIINLLNEFQETDAFPLVFYADPHWNEEGHEFVASTLTRYIAEDVRQVFGTSRRSN